MFTYIRGTVEEIGEDYIVLENQNIGYMIKTPGSVTKKISALHQSITIYTYMYVREDELSLYGFLTKEELDIFKLLITVNGVGPKAANAILTALSADEFCMAVFSGDVKTITRANGIGTKGAQRIIMELKDKLNLEQALNFSSDDAGQMGAADAVSEAVMALVSLGYSNAQALQSIHKVGDTSGMDVQEIIKLALKKLI